MPNDIIVDLAHESGSSARINTTFGFNCFSFRPLTNDGPREILYSEPAFNSGSSPLFSGIPILYPFGGRLNGDSFTWNGQSYQTRNALTYDGNVLHGFVINRPWRILSQSRDTVTATFHASVDDPDLLSQWPGDFQITVRYQLRATSLLAEITLFNPDTKPTPWGFTTHGYYLLDLGGGDPQSAIVRIPAAATWELIDMLPSGRITAVNSENDLRLAKPIAGRTFDAIYTQVEQESDGTFEASIHDPGANRTLRIISTGPIREFVFFTPPTGTSVAIEPYTCAPTTFDLHDRGFDAGLRILDPGQTEHLTLEVRLEEGYNR